LFAPAMLALEGGSNLISPDGSLIFIFFLFLLFVFVMNQLLFKPIGRVLDERETLTEGARAGARAADRVFQSRLLEYEAAIREARADSYQFLQQQRDSALERRTRLIEEAKARASEEIDRARLDIAGQAKLAREALEKDARQLAAQISRTLLGRAVKGGID
jgi:F-type H+-transporting ATPase subunit b